MKRRKRVIIYAILSVIPIAIVYFLYPVYHPNNSINPQLSVEQIKKTTESFLKEQNIYYEKEALNVYAAKNQPLIKDVQSKFGLKKGNVLLRNYLPAYFYEVTLLKDTKIEISSDASNKDKKAGEEKNTGSNTLVNYDFNGNLIQYNRKLDDSVNYLKVPLEEAKHTAMLFIARYTNVYGKILNTASHDSTINMATDITSEGQRIEKNRFFFRWKVYDSVSSSVMVVKTAVVGNMVSQFSVNYSIPGVSQSEDENTVITIIAILFYVVVFLVMAVAGYKKIRAYEIGFKNAILIGLISGFSFAAYILMQMGSDFRNEVFIPMIFIFLFWGIIMFVLWAVSEAVVREIWKDKYYTFDVLMNGDFFHSRIGENIITGGFYGIVMLAIYLVFIAIVDTYFCRIQILPSDEAVKMFSNKLNVVYFFNSDIHFGAFYFVVFIAFIFTMLTRRFSKSFYVIAATLVIWGVVHSYVFTPSYIAVIAYMFIGAVVLFLFYRYEVFTALFAMCVFGFFLNSLQLLWLQNNSFIQIQMMPFVMTGLFVLYAIITLSTKDVISDLNKITPQFALHISERQRLQRELEIARDVQMSFLPRSNPFFPGLELAARCVPAMEVGGDYYDFIEFGNNQLGIVMGDVSGKGTQAAFYKTLSKGFLKAIAKTSSSPKDVLSKMNNMFYENVDRGNFITMLLGVFDLAEKKFVFASAGHNPVIYKKDSNEEARFLKSRGLALGLEKGEIFSKTIQEHEIKFDSNDVFILYTDGFTEAMNKKKEEYGEEELLKIINKNYVESAQEILDGHFFIVKNHIGKAVQHDDMSMVVVKIK